MLRTRVKKRMTESLHVLVAEDSPTQAELLKLCLENRSMRVTVAANGAQALAALKHVRPQVIISDVVMPEMNGYEFCKAVKSDPALRNIPFIIVTSLADSRDILKGLESGADNFIVKPYDEEYLVSRIEYLLLSQDLHNDHQVSMGLEIFFGGKRHFITSERRQILNLLLSTYDAAVRKNAQLIETQEKLRALNDSLEERVEARTEELRLEVARRQAAEEEVRCFNQELEQRVQERTAELEAANRELEHFSSMVSHDIRSPLTSIFGFCEIIVRKHSEGLSDAARRAVERIGSAARRLERISTDLLSFSRVSHHSLKREKVSITAIAQEVVDGLRCAEPERDVKIQVQEDLDAEGDEILLHLVLQNLIGNAFKFTKETRDARIQIGSTSAEGKKAFYVRDNGVGFDMNHADQLFHPFQRLETGPAFPGTGVGLATVQRIILRHGGWIRGEGAPGKGAVFTFTL